MTTRHYLNVATCAAYLVSAVLIALQWTPAALAFSAWMVWLGLASAIYHAREGSIWAVRLDHGAMYGTFVALAIYAGTDHKLAWIAMLVAGAYIGWDLAIRPDRIIVVSMHILHPMMIVLGGLVVLFVLFEGTWSFVPPALAMLAIAWWVWHMENDWGHGVWHVFTAAAILLLFLGVR